MDHFAWQRGFLHTLQSRDVVILHGNIRDRYISRDRRQHFEDSFDDVLVRLLAKTGIRSVRRFDAFAKASELALTEAGVVVVSPPDDFGSPGFNDTSDAAIARIVTDLTSPSQRRVWLLRQMHNLLPYRASYSGQDGLRLNAFQNIVERLAPGNKLLLCYLSDAHVPVELSQHAPRVGFVKVPLPISMNGWRSGRAK